MVDPAELGELVLAGLAKGRARAIEVQRQHGATTARAVRRALDVDVLEGRPPRGRAGRIGRRLRRDGISVSERQVARILAALISVSDTTRQADPIRQQATLEERAA